MNELPMADPGREKIALETFPLDITPDEYAAREGHRWACFSFDEYRYNNEVLTSWIQRLGDIFFHRNGAPSTKELRVKFLSQQEQEIIATEIRRDADGSF
nr:hypothetical protein [uncultured Albidiferax sp.]